MFYIYTYLYYVTIYIKIPSSRHWISLYLIIIPLNPPAGFARGGAEHHQWCRWSMPGPWCGSAPLRESGGSSFSLGGRGCFGLCEFLEDFRWFPIWFYSFYLIYSFLLISWGFWGISLWLFGGSWVSWVFWMLVGSSCEFYVVLWIFGVFLCFVQAFLWDFILGFHSDVLGVFLKASLGSSLFFLPSGSFKMFWVLSGFCRRNAPTIDRHKSTITHCSQLLIGQIPVIFFTW